MEEWIKLNDYDVHLNFPLLFVSVSFLGWWFVQCKRKELCHCKNEVTGGGSWIANFPPTAAAATGPRQVMGFQVHPWFYLNMFWFMFSQTCVACLAWCGFLAVGHAMILVYFYMFVLFNQKIPKDD